MVVMAMSDAEVIQGRLGWEPGDVSEAKPENLRPHPKNKEIYGDTETGNELDETFKESVAEKGVLEPLVITQGKQIISGHRRWLAAKEAELDTVPVRYTEFDSELAEREALVEFNRQREKTPGQIVNEFEEILEIEQERAKERQAEAGENNLPNESTSSGNVSKTSDSDGGIAREKAAERVNADVSGRTLEKGLEVKKKAESGDEAARDAWEGLKTGEKSYHTAHTEAKGGSSDTGDEDVSNDAGDPDQDDLGVLTSQQTDEWSSPREVVGPIDAAVGGFDLDPCSGAESSPFAAETYTEDDDGLAQPWNGSVWVNPPYSGVAEWVTKAVEEVENERADRVVFLCKGDSSTDWWQEAAGHATLVTAIDHRLSFGDGENSAPFASHIFVFGDVSDGLADSLRHHGTIMTFGWEDADE